MTEANEALRRMQLKNARRVEAGAVAMLEQYVGDARRNISNGHSSSSIARNMGGAVADLAAASAQIELLTGGFE